MWISDDNGTILRGGRDGAFETLPPHGGSVHGMTVGPDGNVWYVNATTGQVGYVDPGSLATALFDIPTSGSRPEEITAGPAGDQNSVWFTEQGADRIGRVDTVTHVVADYGGLTAGAQPNGIVAGDDGGLWFAEYGIGKIGRIDPVTDQVTEYDLPGALGGPDRMTVAPGGRIWFTLPDSSQIGSFIPGPNPTFDLISTPTAGAGPSGITFGPDGHVWFAEYNNHAVARIDGSYSQLPTTTIDSGPAGTITDTSATFTFHSDDPAAGFECSLDGGPFAACTSPDTIAGLAVGQHTFTVRAVNGAGTEPNPPSRMFVVSLRSPSPSPSPSPPPSPVTWITGHPPAQSPDQVVRFAFAGKVPGQIDPYAGVTFQCRLDGGPFAPCTSPYTTAQLALATHTFEVRAVSAQGVVDPNPAGWTFQVVQPLQEVHTYLCAIPDIAKDVYYGYWTQEFPGAELVGRGLYTWPPCSFPDLVCPAHATCVTNLWVDESDDSYLNNHDIHLQRLEEAVPGDWLYRDRLYCFAPPASVPLQPQIEVRAYPQSHPYDRINKGHACHEQDWDGSYDPPVDVHERFRCLGYLHVSKPNSYPWGESREENVHLECGITLTVQRHLTELAEVVSDKPGHGAVLVVVAPGPGNVYITATIAAHTAFAARRRVLRGTPPALLPVRIAVRTAGAVRLPLRLNRAAITLRRKHPLHITLTTTFQPPAGAAVTRITRITLRRA